MGISTSPSEPAAAWRAVYTAGAAAAAVSLVGTLADIAITAVPGWQASTERRPARDWFEEFAVNPLLGLRNLDLLNVVLGVAALPMYVALYGAHRRSSRVMATLALTTVGVGTAVWAATNVALPMLELSRQYAAARTDEERATMEAAGEALLGRGAHGSMGAFPGFVLPTIGTLLMTVAMLRGRVFGRVTALTGLSGISLLLAYVAGTTFGRPSGVLMGLAAPGGLLMMAWNVMVARKLRLLARG